MFFVKSIGIDLFANIHRSVSSRSSKLLSAGFHRQFCFGITRGTQKVTALQKPAHEYAKLDGLCKFMHIPCGRVLFSSGTGSEMTGAEIKKVVGSISEKFSEAMELMNDARSSLGTVYFSEDVLDTQAQVEETLGDYHNLLNRLNDKQKKAVIQSIGLKMEELKAQIKLLEDLAKE